MSSISGFFKSFPQIAFILLFLPVFVQAQEKQFHAKDTVIGVNEYFLIKATAPFSGNLRISDFPDIQDFSRKRTVYSREDSLIVIRQYYKPRKRGSFSTPGLFLILNGDSIFHKPVTIKVTAPKKNSTEPDFPKAEAPYEESKPEAFLRLDMDNKSVFNRQSVKGTLNLYVPEDGKADLNFIDLTQQITRMSEKLRVSGTVASIEPLPSSPSAKVYTYNGKRFRKYPIISCSWMPYLPGELEIPELELVLLTYKESRNKGFTDRMDQVITLRSSGTKIPIKALPEHPHKDQINAGRFSMNSWLSTKEPEAGKAIHLSVEIKGNIPSVFLKDPAISQGSLKFYRQTEKNGTFRYQVVAEKPGEYKLSDYIHWIYFNSRTERYDTLRPTLVIQVQGAEDADGYKRAREFDPFYGIIETSSSSVRSIHQDDRLKFFGNVFILAMLAFAGWLILWKKKSKGKGIRSNNEQ